MDAISTSLTELDLQPEYRSDVDDLVEDFYLPCLQRCRLYRRAVGFFTSRGLSSAAQGISALIEGDGRMLLVASPLLDPDDLEAIEKGYLARDDAVLRSILREIETTPDGLVQDRLGYLAWLIAEERLEIRIAISLDEQGRPSRGIYHEKLGVFSDADEKAVVFTGSPNETAGGLVDNFETIDVFCSWNDPAGRVPRKIGHFERLWNNRTPRLSVIPFPKAALEQLLRYRPAERPRGEPKLPPFGIEFPFPSHLWDHQVEAIRSWESHERTGLLSMATGSGKTLTALVAAQRCQDLQFLVIAVPSHALVEQWVEEVQTQFESAKIVAVYGQSQLWQDRLFGQLRASRRKPASRMVIAIGTLKSLASDRFDSVLTDAKPPGHTLLIVDEAHNAGAPTYRRVLRDDYTWRLGLSATPARHFDEEGSQVLQSYFGSTVFTYSLRQALKDERLCPYRYLVYPAHLTEAEFHEYSQLTRQIISNRTPSGQRVTRQTDNRLDGDPDKVKKLLIRRARILKKCGAKMEALDAALDVLPTGRGLVYCADQDQLAAATQVLKRRQILFLTYTSGTPDTERRAALGDLARGSVPWIVAIDCLDEGVDVPAVEQAILLASSSNKRQFVQRRGRILRQAVGKKLAILVDIIALPPVTESESARWMLNGELARVREMAELAENREEALLVVKRCADPYGVSMTELLSGEGDG